MKYRVGLLGAGYVSQFHVSALRLLQNVEIVGVADVDRERADAVCRQFELPAAFGSLQELMAAGVDVVHILTPPATHADLTIEAIRSGCHVLVEKPLATSVEDCQRIGDAAEQCGRQVCVNHSNLRDPFVARAMQLVQSGAIGEVVNVTYLRSSNYPPYLGGRMPPHYRDGGYPFRDMGVHGLYTIRAFLGEILDVSACFSSKGGDPNLLYDEWMGTVRCERGLGQLQLSWNVNPLQSRLIVQGTRGVLHADLFSMFVTVRKKTRLPGSAERIWNATSEALQMAVQVPANVLRFLRKKIRRYHGLHETVREFYCALEENRPVPFPVSDGSSVVKWTEHMARKADEEKRRLLQTFETPLTAEILVTGASGFIGRHLVERLLAEGHRVRILVRRPPTGFWADDERIEVVLGDLGDPDVVSRAVAGVTTVYHLGAALRGPAHDFERGTVVGTRNVVNSILNSSKAKLVHVSSLSVLHAAAARDATVREDWPLEPHPNDRGMYTRTKLQAEAIVREAVSSQGLRAVILRPGQVFGPGGELLTPAVARKAGSRLLVLGDGTVPLPLVFVGDVVNGLVSAADSGIEDGSIFHLVDDAEQLTQNDFLREILKSSDSRPRITHIPYWLVTTLSAGVRALAALARRNAPLSPYRVKSALSPMRFDCTAARERLRWKPEASLSERIQQTMQVRPLPTVHDETENEVEAHEAASRENVPSGVC